MRLSIRHTTHYLFDTPVVHALQRLRLTPKQTQGQEILEWEMEYHNAHPEFVYEDQHHNTAPASCWNIFLNVIHNSGNGHPPPSHIPGG